MIHTEQRHGLTIEVDYDEDSPNPREWSNVGTMVCWHRRYHLGDEQPTCDPTAWLEDLPEGSFILPLYLYDHSGITISTSKFSCPWDSGQVGYIYVSLADATKEWPDLGGEALRERAGSVLRSEVRVYDDYLTGNVAAYVIKDENDNVLESCCGFYPDRNGDHSYCIEQARDAADSLAAKMAIGAGT